MGLGELIAERCEGLGPARGGERVEADEQLAGAGADVAGDGQCLADQPAAITLVPRSVSGALGLPST